MPPRKTTPKISPKKKLLINADHREECRAVILDDGKLEEVVIEHSARELVKGNVYLGVISRVEPAIEAAFVDFGGKKFGFLPFKDVLRESYLQTGERKAKVRIQDVLVRGQKILVQVVKESRDAKGPSLNNGITIPGRFLVLMYGSLSTGVSRKIEDEAERRKLKEILSDLELPENMGVIIRTAGVGRTKTELQKDLQMLLKIWENIQETLQKSSGQAPVMLYEGPDMVVRTVRDHFTADTSEIIVDNKESYKALKDFMKMVMPRMGSRIKLYQETQPLFSAFKVEDQIENIYQRKVNLPSGGSIVFDMGEAMVCVDVNSGKTTSASELEETALRTNTEAAEEIARQLRLRDLGGLIVIDFIDMFQKKNKALVEKQIKQACKKDKARINISRISRFGLLEMSRQRMSPPLKEGVYDTCSTCSGTGMVRADANLALRVIRKIQESIAADSVKSMKVTTSSGVANYLLNHKMGFLVNLQEAQGIHIQFEGRERLLPEDFTYEVLERKKVVEDKDKKPEESREEPRDRSREEPRDRSRGRRRSSASASRRKESIPEEKEIPSETKVAEAVETVVEETEESGEDKSSQNRRRPPNSGQRRRSVRRTSSSSSSKRGGVRGRRWRSQRADKGGTQENGTPAAGSPETSSASGLESERMVSPSLPLAGEIIGRMEGQQEANTRVIESARSEEPAPARDTESSSRSEETSPGV